MKSTLPSDVAAIVSTTPTSFLVRPATLGPQSSSAPERAWIAPSDFRGLPSSRENDPPTYSRSPARAMVWMSPSVRMLQSGSRRPFARRCTTSVFPTSTPPTAEMSPRRNQPPRPSATASATLPLTTARMAPTAPALSTSAHDPVERPINRKSPPT